MRALSIRQPWAELILMGVKTAEYRTRPTKLVGERFWIYAARSDGYSGPFGAGPGWRLLGELPKGVIVGSAVIERVELGDDGFYHWHLADVERARTLRKPSRHPQPTWFEPF